MDNDQLLFLRFFQLRRLDNFLERFSTILGTTWDLDALRALTASQGGGGPSAPVHKLFTPLSLVINPKLQEFLQKQAGGLQTPEDETPEVLKRFDGSGVLGAKPEDLNPKARKPKGNSSMTPQRAPSGKPIQVGDLWYTPGPNEVVLPLDALSTEDAKALLVGKRRTPKPNA